MASLFERLEKGRPTPLPKQEISPAQRLLDWLQRWNKPTVCTREILIYGPSCTRNRKSVLDATEILVRNGWLKRNETKQRNWRQWQIVRKPIVHPTIAD